MITSKVNTRITFLLIFFLSVVSVLMAQNSSEVLHHFELEIDDENFQNLMDQREIAMTLGYLNSNFRSSVPAKILLGGEIYDVEVRLKGDLGDHWKDADALSFRVKVLNGKTINGLKSFSIQHPVRRDYLNDWVYNKVLNYHGLLNTRYDFIEFVLNGKSQGVYSVEEYADKYLLERNFRREGPVFKVDDQYFWTYRLVGNKGAGIENISNFRVKPLGGTKVVKKEVLRNQYELASQLLYGFARRDFQTHEVFQVEDLAMAFALTHDVFGHDHAVRIPNIRFYFNPVTCKIEPIAFDVGGISPIKKIFGDLHAFNYDKFFADPEIHPNWFRTFFRDPVFRQAYTESLRTLGDDDWLNDFWSSIEKEYQFVSALMGKHFSDYKFDKQVLKQNVQMISTRLSQGYGDESKIEENNRARIYEQGLDWERYGIQAAFKDINLKTGELILQVGNTSSSELVLESVSINEELKVPVKKSQTLKPKKPYHFVKFEEVKFEIPKSWNWNLKHRRKMVLNYKEKGSDVKLQEEVGAFPVYDKLTFKDDFFRKESNWQSLSYLQLDRNTGKIHVKKGVHTIKENTIIPAGYELHFEKGAEIIFENGASLLSYSSVYCNGTSKKMVKFTSGKGNQGGGLLVIKAPKKSMLNYTQFKGLGNPHTSRWSTTGAVSFYESNVELNNCEFLDNQSEDGLNVVRAQFMMEKCLFQNTFSDAFDADFCQGEILDSKFINCGNDGIDVSGSQVTVKKTDLSQIIDKGISSGERSQMKAYNVTVSEASIALAAKDESTLFVDNVKLQNNLKDVAVYQKKSEFGPAQIEMVNVTYGFDDLVIAAEKKSSLRINGKDQFGQDLSLYQKLYTTRDFSEIESYIEKFPTVKRYENLRSLYQKYAMPNDADRVSEIIKSLPSTTPRNGK